MNIHRHLTFPSYSYDHRNILRPSKDSITQQWKESHQQDYSSCNKSTAFPQLRWRRPHTARKLSEAKTKQPIVTMTVNTKEDVPKKKGTIAGAVALIIGTSIGSGILALPKKTSPAGLLPSSISMTMCWAFLLIEALLLVEVNVFLQKRKKKISKLAEIDDELRVISITTMAQETLGEFGGAFATVTYVFLAYTSTIAYSSKSGEIIHQLISYIPESVSGIFFTCLFAILISIGGTRATDQVNQCLTASMIGLLVAIEVLAVWLGNWSGFEGNVGNWEKIPPTLPVMIFALVYHDLAPVLCAYLEGDLSRIRTSLLLGSIVPLLALLVWEAIALGLSNQTSQVSDPVELLASVEWGGISYMVEAFSLLAVGTSLIGTLLSFSEFFKEQLNSSNNDDNDNNIDNSLDSPSAEISERLYNISWWDKNKTSAIASLMVIVPSLLVSTTIPDAFYAATDIAGGYCMTMLYGILPPAMAWKMISNKEKQFELAAVKEENSTLSRGFALIGVGLFACGIVVEQFVQDFSSLIVLQH